MPREIINRSDFGRSVSPGARRSAGSRSSGDLPRPSDADSPVTPPVATADEYKDRLLKYIPAEVVAAYLAIQGIIPSITGPGASQTALWIAFLVLLFLTPFYLMRVQNVSKRVQLAISTVSFAIWVFSVGGPFAFFPWYQSAMGAVVLLLFTFAVPIIEPNS
jgi:hypothetical protein